MSGYYNDSKRMQLCTALIEIKTILNNSKTRLTALKDSDNISINYKKALIKGLLLLELYIKYVDRQTNDFSVNDPELIAFVLDFRNPNFISHLAGEDQMVIQNVISRGSTVASKGATTVSTSVSDTVASTLNSTDPITQIAVSFTFTPQESNYNKSGFAFSNQIYSGSQTTFTLNSANNIIIKSDGDPFPALAGDPTFTNDYANNVARVWTKVPGPLIEQNYNYTFPYRGGTNTSNPQEFFKGEMGIQGIFANGVALYSPSAGSGTVPGTTISGNNQYNLNAVFFEQQYGIDEAGGHPSPEGNIVNGQQGQYHYHDGMFIASSAWNNSTFYNSNSYFSGTNYGGDYLRHSDGHSKILAICFDGYPVYGPYGYTSAQDASSEVILMQPGYVTYPTEFTGRPYTYTQVVSGYTISAGAFLDDYYYDSTVGATLDEYNGRYCVTPDYPNGTYAYFITVDENSDPVFPYIIGSYTKQQRTVINNGYVG